MLPIFQSFGLVSAGIEHICRRLIELKFNDLAGTVNKASSTNVEEPDERCFFFSETNMEEQVYIPINFELQITDLRLDLPKKVSFLCSLRFM